MLIYCINRYPGASPGEPREELGERQNFQEAHFPQAPPTSLSSHFPLHLPADPDPTLSPLHSTPLPPCHWDPLILFLLFLAWNPHSHSQSLLIPHATSSLESALVFPGQNDLFPLLQPQNVDCCSVIEFSSFCLTSKPLPDFQGHLGQLSRLINFGISTLPDSVSCL